MNRKEPSADGAHEFVKRLLTTVAVVTAVLLALLGAWQVRSVVFLLFLAVLLAIFWRGLSRPLVRFTPLPEPWAVGLTVLLLGLLSGALVWLFAPPLVAQARLLVEAVPEALEVAERLVRGTPLEVEMDEGVPEVPGMMDTLLPRLTDAVGQVVAQFFGTVAAGAGIITNLVFLFFAAFFFALQPESYRRGLVQLVPKGRRARFDEVLRASGETLWSWLLGRLLAMLAVGVMVTLGLWALDVPLALLLGVIAFLLDFVPYLGPFAAALPALLLAFSVSPLTAVWVALLYLVVQQLESYLVTPVVQQRAAELPPVLTLLAVFAFGGLFGLWGLLVATPLMAVILVFVRTLYLEDVLGDTPDDPPADRPPRRSILVQRRNA